MIIGNFLKGMKLCYKPIQIQSLDSQMYESLEKQYGLLPKWMKAHFYANMCEFYFFNPEQQSLQQSCSELTQKIDELERRAKESHEEAQKLVFEKTEAVSVLQQSLNEKGEELNLITQKVHNSFTLLLLLPYDVHTQWQISIPHPDL